MCFQSQKGLVPSNKPTVSTGLAWKEGELGKSSYSPVPRHKQNVHFTIRRKPALLLRNSSWGTEQVYVHSTASLTGHAFREISLTRPRFRLSTELTNQKNPHCIYFRNVHSAAAPPEPALRDTRFGEHLGEVNLASFRTRPMQSDTDQWEYLRPRDWLGIGELVQLLRSCITPGRPVGSV